MVCSILSVIPAEPVPEQMGSVKPLLSVIPAEAGIQGYLEKSLLYFWIPASAGMTIEDDTGILIMRLWRTHDEDDINVLRR